MFVYRRGFQADPLQRRGWVEVSSRGGHYRFSIDDLLGSCLGQKHQVWESVRLAILNLVFFMESTER